MELKPYQQKVIDDLQEFITYIDRHQQLDVAYKEYWNSKGVNIQSKETPNGLPAYKAIIPGVPHVAMKVPTAGGKTFIASNALKTIFDGLGPTKEKVVVWLVPSITILDQTVKNLSNPEHPYRQKIDTHFNGRVEVYEKESLLQGASFNSTTVKEQLSILVLSFDSFRTRTKDGRKVYQENENLTNFFDGTETDILLEDSDEMSLMNVIRKLNPVVVVDESHNAESNLSVDMLNNLNPSFVLDLTATPRDNSNIISFIDALALKKENMVKLPVLVYNHHDVNEVIQSSVELRNNLELAANKEKDTYIRPIVLFQAEPKNRKDSETFEKIKQKLIKKGIPKEEIAIKTANINEIQGHDLMDKDCPIRYIITINALKEGWDAPFAYILASLANRTSKVDVEQILGRILRQPYVRKHQDPVLNMSYVFTASNDFHNTLNSVVQGLNKSGFSKKDFRVTQEQQEIAEQPVLDLKAKVEPTNLEEINDTPITIPTETKETKDSTINEILDHARNQELAFEDKVEQAQDDITWGYTDEVFNASNVQEVKEHYRDIYKDIKLPQFFIDSPQSSFMNDGIDFVKLSSSMLLDDEFELRKQNTDIDFDAISLDVYQVDIQETGIQNDYTPKYQKLSQKQSEAFMDYINGLPEESQIRTLTSLMISTMGHMSKYADSDLNRFVQRVIEDADAAVRHEMKANPYNYANKIKKHIEKLAQSRTEEVFQKWIDSDKIFMKDSYQLPNHIAPSSTIDTIPKSLYVAEGSLNNLEREFITEIASLQNIKFWHKIPERKGFYLNGFINHYPDFLIVTESGKKIIVETKGSHLDNTDSIQKLRLGKTWANKAGKDYAYFMVFKEDGIKGANTIDEAIDIIKEL